MNLLLIEPEELDASGRARVLGARARHVREVLKTPIGGRVRAGVVDGGLGHAELLAIGDDGAIELAVALEEPAPPRGATDVVLAVPRPKSLAKVLPELATFGVDRVFLIRTWKVEKPYLESELLTPAGHGPLLRAGAMQGRTTLLPQLAVAPLFRPWIEDEAPSLFAGHARRWVLDAGAATATRELGPIPADARAVIAIGPEGGLLPFELERFEAAGFTRVALGTPILRAETAVVAALAQLALLRSRS